MRIGRFLYTFSAALTASCAGPPGPVISATTPIAQPTDTVSLRVSPNDSVTGVVTSGTSGRPIDRAQVYFPNTSTGVLTDGRGRFTLPTMENADELRVEMVGYGSRVVSIPDGWSGAVLRIPMATDLVCLVPPIVPPVAMVTEEYWFVVEPRPSDPAAEFEGRFEVTAEPMEGPKAVFRGSGESSVAIRVPGPGYYRLSGEADGYRSWAGGEYSISDCSRVEVRRVNATLVPVER